MGTLAPVTPRIAPRVRAGLTAIAASADHLTAILRLVAVPVLLVGETYVTRSDETDTRFYVVLALFAAYAILTLVLAGRRGRRFGIFLAGCDLAFAGALTYTSGGAFSQLRLAFLFPIVTTVFRSRPWLTAGATCVAIAVYVGQSLPHPSTHSRSDAPSFIAVQVVYVTWLGLALTLLSLLLTRREQAVERLSEQRQRLVSEVYGAEERERQRLAEDLHDNTMQHLLAARRELAAAASGDADSPQGRAFSGLVEALSQLRATVADLHPHLLDQLGVQAALEHTATEMRRRGACDLALDLDGFATGGPNDRVLLRSATELLANVERHARARRASLRLALSGEYDVLRVTDDGIGFDLEHVLSRVRPGHIGLLSLRERAEALGGSLRIDTRPGHGTTATLRLPRARAPEAAAR
jgi:two-component system NarL family sensor kinase